MRNKNSLAHSRTWHRLLAMISILVMLLGNQAPFPISSALAESANAPLAATNTLTLNVISARTESRAFGGSGVVKGAAIPNFKYIINIDNTGTTEQRSPSEGCSPESAGYPDSCNWVSIAGAASNSPIYTQGDQSDFPLDLPDGRYLISVIADGYRLDGKHFTVPMNGPVTVELQPFPLPDATIRAFVFEDISPTNGAPDAPIEHGLAGFVGHIADYIGEVTTDIYGNPLCTVYKGEDPVTHVVPPQYLDGDMLPVVAQLGGQCVSDANGDLVIPHLGPNRYALSAVAPDGTNWIQTTTLEGNHDWDAWVMEGSTGYDTEFVVAGEPFPTAIFGFVQEKTSNLGGSGTIKGVVDAVKVYVPTVGGVTLPGNIWGGMAGGKIDKPIDSPWIALSDLGAGDTAVWIGQGDANGAFTIPNVPNGTYTLTWWDEPQDYILNLTNVTVANGEVVDLGILPLNGWWTTLEGYVFNDSNRNGIRDAGEEGLDNYTVVMRKRENSVMDRGAVLVTTGPNPDTGEHGYYFMENLYPMTQWLIVEAYNDLFYTTGVTYQADNQSEPTTILGAGVDVSILPIIGLGGRLDWGVHAYDPTGANEIDPRNGGIAGTVSYDTTRNEIDPRYAAVEDWQPGISDLTVNLYTTVDCPVDGSAPCDDSGRYQLDTDGSILKGQLINSTVTETWQRPGADNNANGDGYCVPRDVDGNPLAYPDDQQVIKSNSDCLEGPLMGVQFQMGYSTVDGNYGFGDGCFGEGGFDIDSGTCADGSDPTPLPAADYLVDVVVPDDATGRPMYQVTKEEDINIANGDQFVPQIPPPACAGPLHTVDVAGIGEDNYPAQYTQFTLYNNATGGTFTLSNGIDTTAAIAFDATAAMVESSLEAFLPAEVVAVSGSGTAADPWIISFMEPTPNLLTVDDTNLIASASSSLEISGFVVTLSNDAAGGTFDLSYDGNPIGTFDYNASAGDIQTALMSIDSGVVVSGSGTSLDPWIITFSDAFASDLSLLTVVDNLTKPASSTISSAGIPASTPVENATFASELNGSYYEGHRQQRSLGGPDLQPVYRRTPTWALLGPCCGRPELLQQPQIAALRREGRRALRPGRHLRLDQPSYHNRRVGLQRFVGCAPALHQPHQLPHALGCVCRYVSHRRQRPGRSRPPQPELQTAVPYHLGRVRGLPRSDRAR
jgi:hypothetical protein